MFVPVCAVLKDLLFLEVCGCAHLHNGGAELGVASAEVGVASLSAVVVDEDRQHDQSNYQAINGHDDDVAYALCETVAEICKGL